MVLAANVDSSFSFWKFFFPAWRAAKAENDDRQTEDEGQKDLPEGR